MKPWTALFCALSLAACVAPAHSDDDDDAAPDATASSSAGTGGDSASATTGAGAGPGSGAGGGEGGQVPFAPPALRHRVVLGHYLGGYDLMSFATDDLSPHAAGALEPGAPTSGILGIAKHDVLAVGLEGGDAIQVYDASTMSPIAGSPYATGWAPVDLAHDDARDRLYVYCIGTAGNPEMSLLTVYDTSTVPYQELPGSPFDIDVPALRIDVDPITGAVFGVSLFTYWGVNVDDGGVTHVEGSPREMTQGRGTDIVVDHERRRLYVGEQKIAADQHVHVVDIDTFAPHQRSPVDVPGSLLGEIALDPSGGDLWVVDYGSSKLHSIQASPLMRRDTCGTDGCFIPTTETGVAIDHELDRLFIVHIPDANQPDDGPGFLTAWDISDPGMPTEITTSGARPSLGIYPVTATTF